MTRPQLAPAERRRYERNILLFYGFQLACNLALWSSIWVLYLRDMRGLSLTQITALDAPFWLIAIVAEVPTGTVADRWGRKASLLAGALAYVAALAFFGLASNYPLLLLSYLAWPVSMALMSGADSAFVYDSLAMLGREGEFRKVIGRSNAMHSVGFLVGGLIGAPLAAVTDLAVPILVSAAFAAVGAAIALGFREPRHLDAPPSRPYLETMRAALSFSLARPALRWTLGVRAAIMATGLLAIIFRQPFLAEFDLPVSLYGLVTTPISLLSIGASLLAYRFAARLGERNLLYLLGAGCVGALFVLGIVPSVAAFSMFAVLAVCQSVTGVVTSDIINRQTPQPLRATVMSVGQMGFSLVALVAEPLLGYAADRGSLQTMFLIAAVGAALLVGGLLAAWTGTAGVRNLAPGGEAPSPTA
jgi:MFS family permease